MRTLERTTQFKRDFKREMKRRNLAITINSVHHSRSTSPGPLGNSHGLRYNTYIVTFRPGSGETAPATPQTPPPRPHQAASEPLP